MTSKNKQFRVKKIMITRAEGPSALCNIPFETDNFAEVNAKLSSWVDLSEKHGDKVDFAVTWTAQGKDDITWAGTYLLIHGKHDQSLNQHIQQYAETEAGIRRPDALYSDDNWATHLANIEHTKERYMSFLELCDLHCEQHDTCE